MNGFGECYVKSFIILVSFSVSTKQHFEKKIPSFGEVHNVKKDLKWIMFFNSLSVIHVVIKYLKLDLIFN